MRVNQSRRAVEMRDLESRQHFLLLRDLGCAAWENAAHWHATVSRFVSAQLVFNRTSRPRIDRASPPIVPVGAIVGVTHLQRFRGPDPDSASAFRICAVGRVIEKGPETGADAVSLYPEIQ